jgi:hypothetical protein
MTYQVNKTNGELLVPVADRQVSLIAGNSIKLLGKNYGSYGEIMAENLVSLAENFASPNTAPPGGSDTSVPLATGLHATAPLIGQLWFDTTNQALNVRVQDGSAGKWMPLYGYNTGIDLTDIKDVSGNFHKALKIKVDTAIIAIVSKDISYVPHADTGLQSAFANIKAGININGTLNGSNDPVYKLRGRSIEAEFADMAEIYHSDVELSPGNLVKLGGYNEITMTTDPYDTAVFGVISTQPGFLLNSSKKEDPLAYPVALKGRVPCLVKGTVRKGQRIVASDIAGVGMATDTYESAAIIGRAIGEKNNDDIGPVEVAVGVK